MTPDKKNEIVIVYSARPIDIYSMFLVIILNSNG